MRGCLFLEYAQVVKMLGNGRLEAMCFDGEKRLAHIRGKLRKKVWINQGDIILLSLRDYQDEKGDVILKYTADEARSLKAYGELPDSAKINETDTFVCVSFHAGGVRVADDVSFCRATRATTNGWSLGLRVKITMMMSISMTSRSALTSLFVQSIYLFHFSYVFSHFILLCNFVRLVKGKASGPKMLKGGLSDNEPFTNNFLCNVFFRHGMHCRLSQILCCTSLTSMLLMCTPCAILAVFVAWKR